MVKGVRRKMEDFIKYICERDGLDPDDFIEDDVISVKRYEYGNGLPTGNLLMPNGETLHHSKVPECEEVKEARGDYIVFYNDLYYDLSLPSHKKDYDEAKLSELHMIRNLTRISKVPENKKSSLIKLEVPEYSMVTRNI